MILDVLCWSIFMFLNLFNLLFISFPLCSMAAYHLLGVGGFCIYHILMMFIAGTNYT